jgi:hypothetical protein
MENTTPLADDATGATGPGMDTREPEAHALTDYQVAKKLVQLKQSADSRGIEFSLSFKTVKKLMISQKCYYTGKRFTTGLNARSVDRVDSTIGYVDGNVVPCTVEINQKKSNLTHNEIVLLAKKIFQHQNRKK